MSHPNLVDRLAWAICPHIKQWCDENVEMTPKCARCPVKEIVNGQPSIRLCRINAQGAAVDASRILIEELGE